MDDHRFDEVTRAMASETSRRRVLGLLAGGFAVAFGGGGQAARAKGGNGGGNETCAETCKELFSPGGVQVGSRRSGPARISHSVPDANRGPSDAAGTCLHHRSNRSMRGPTQPKSWSSIVMPRCLPWLIVLRDIGLHIPNH